MKILQIIFSGFILMLMLAGNIEAQTREFSAAEGSRASNDKIYDFEKWDFSIRADKYEIDQSGCGKKTDKNNDVKKFCFSIEDAEFIDGVIYAEYQNDLLLVVELNFGGWASAFIVRIDGKTLKIKWRTSIPTFNVAKGLIEDNSAYLAGMGFISKIDLGSGKYIWKHDNLYRKYDESGAFNVFLAPQVEDNLVIFKEDDILNKGFDHQIHVDKKSGKIIKVLLN